MKAGKQTTLRTQAAVSGIGVHSGLPAERYDGVAPELIGTTARPNVASDLYALGCLLWQLLLHITYLFVEFALLND
jgi:hypothetical protein